MATKILDKTSTVTKTQPSIEPHRQLYFIPAEWLMWRMRFERYMTASGLDEDTANNHIKTINYVGYTLGDKADEKFRLKSQMKAI